MVTSEVSVEFFLLVIDEVQAARTDAHDDAGAQHAEDRRRVALLDFLLRFRLARVRVVACARGGGHFSQRRGGRAAVVGLGRFQAAPDVSVVLAPAVLGPALRARATVQAVRSTAARRAVAVPLLSLRVACAARHRSRPQGALTNVVERRRACVWHRLFHAIRCPYMSPSNGRSAR